MTVFLIGLAVAMGVLRLIRGEGRGSGALWVAPIGLLVVGQIWIHGDRLAGYQLRVLGQRFHMSEDEGGGRSISGDPDRSDVFVDGAGGDVVARILRRGDSVSVAAGEGRASVLLVREGSGRGAVWQMLRSVPLSDGDVVTVGGGDESDASWTFRRLGSALGVRGTEDSFEAADGRRAVLPYPESSGLLGLFPSRPSVFQRTYPLAEVLAGGGTPGVAAGLASFMFYTGGRPHLAVLDDGVGVASGGMALEPRSSMALGEGEGPLASVLVAGLPLRDYPERHLAMGERYGVRILRAFEPRRVGAWLTLGEPSPRVVPISPDDGSESAVTVLDAGDPAYSVWIMPGAAGTGSGGIRLHRFSNRFGAVSQALLRLPERTDRGGFGLLTPSGLAEWGIGEPLTLGDRERGLLLRVDAFAASPAFLLMLAGLFTLAALAFVVLPAPGGAKALALVVVGLSGLRALMSLSALAGYPFVEEGHHISLWLIPALPWLVCLAGLLRGRASSAEASVAVTPRGFSGGYMGTVGASSGGWWRNRRRGGRAPERVAAVLAGAALVLWTLVLFPGSPAKAGALSLVTMGLVATLFLKGPLGRLGAGVSSAASRVQGLKMPGMALGVGLFVLRVLLEAAGYREQLTLGGTRIGLSVLYTPLTAAMFGLLLWVHLERVNRVEPVAASRLVALAWIDLGAYLAAAFVAVSLWISDFGIALTVLPGPLLLLAVVGWYWSRRFGPGAALGGLLPLGLFLVLQLSPQVMRPGLPEAAESTRLSDWSRNELLLLERGDPDLLKLIGESRSEALAVMRETMRSYTRGNWTGRGFLQGRVSTEIRSTAGREHAAGGLLASQWGLLGTLGLVLMLGAALLPYGTGVPRMGGAERGPLGWSWALGFVGVALLAIVLPPPANVAVVAGATLSTGWAALIPVLPGRGGEFHRRLWTLPGEGPAWPSYASADAPWLVGATAVATLVAAGLYMVLANYGLVLFTGKNVYLLGLDSLGDTLEALALIGAGALGLAAPLRKVADTGAGQPSQDFATGDAVRPRIGWRRVG